MKVLKKLKEKSKSKLFKKINKKVYYLFSKSGFTDDLKKEAKKDINIRLIELEDLFFI